MCISIHKASKASQAKQSEPVSDSNTHNTCQHRHITQNNSSHNTDYKLAIFNIKPQR